MDAPPLSETARTATSSVIRDLLRHARRPDVISLAGGIPTPASFPVDDVAAAAIRALERHGSDALQYGLTEGNPELRDWAADWFGDRDRARSDAVLITTGSQQALDLLSRVTLDPGDTVVSEDPGYIGALQVFRANRAHLVGVPVDADGLRTDVLDGLLRSGLRPKLVYTVVNFQNPAGVTVSAERRIDLARLADRYGFVVAEDDPYGMLRFEGAHLPSIAHATDRVVRLKSTSKIVAPGLRTGFALGPDELIGPMIVAKQAADLHTGTLDQHLLCELIVERPAWLDAHIDAIVPLYRAGRDALVEAVVSTFGAHVIERVPEGGMFLWLDLQDGTDTTAALAVALDHGVAYVPGAAFAVADPVPSALRLSYATPTPDELREAVRRLRAALS